jgi:diacylglycerol kinase (ATP)
MGRARGPWGDRPFIESVGCGLVADLMAGFDRRKEQTSPSLSPEQEVQAAREELRQVLRRARARECRVEADGQDLSGRYLLVEVMNIRHIGPRLLLAPHADPGDGLLDVVALGEAHRRQLDAYLRGPASPTAPALPSGVVPRQARHVLLEPGGQRVHLDDETWPDKERAAEPHGPIHLQLQAQALAFLSP